MGGLAQAEDGQGAPRLPLQLQGAVVHCRHRHAGAHQHPLASLLHKAAQQLHVG